MLAFMNLVRVQLAIAAVFAYFCGCFNGAVFISKFILKDDIRSHGSGNGGLTNFHRTFGGPLTFAVIAMDVLKAVIALSFATWLAQNSPALLQEGMNEFLYGTQSILLFRYWAALFCLLGHMFPCMFHFRGGKGILSGGTIAIIIDWRIALVVWGGFLILTALTRYVSLGSVWAGSTFIICTWLFFRDPVIGLIGTLLGGLVVWKHRGNIQRLLSGTERKLTFRKKEGTGQ